VVVAFYIQFSFSPSAKETCSLDFGGVVWYLRCHRSRERVGGDIFSSYVGHLRLTARYADL